VTIILPQQIGEVAADAMNSLLMVHPQRCSQMLVTAGAVPALIHAVNVSPAPAVQAASTSSLQNLASVSDAIRSDIIVAGGVRPLVKMLRRADITPVVAAAACGALQNLAILPESEEAIVEGGGIPVLLQHCSKGIGAEYDDRDQPVVEAAALAIMNLAAGSEGTRKAISAHDGIPVLAALLQLHKRHNPKTGVLEMPTPSLRLVYAAGAALRGIALLPEMQGPLRSTGVVRHVGLLLERLLKENQWIPAILGGLQADALESLLGLLRNMALLDTGTSTRMLCAEAHIGTLVGKMMVRLIPKEAPPPPPPDAPVQKTSPQVTNASAMLVLEGIAAARNLSAAILELQEQLGGTGFVESLVALLNHSPSTPWVSTQHCVEALHCLANLSEFSEANRTRAVAATCLRQVMTFAGNSSSMHVSGAACLALQSLAQSPEARLKLLERDGLKLLYSLLDHALTPESIAGASGAIVHLGRAAKVQLHKFVQLGGAKLITRVGGECSSNAALQQLLNLVYLMAVNSELKIKLIEDGVMRVTLNLLSKKGALPEPLLELCSAIIASVAKDRHARSHMLKMGAVAVLEDANETFTKHNDKIKADTRRAINSLTSIE
jgi:hypothetical protein